MKINKNLPEGLIDMADIPFVPSWKLVEESIKKYGWKDDKEYFKKRLSYVCKQLNNHYDIDLAREKASLYFVNSTHVEFMTEMGDPVNWAYD